MNRWIMGSIAGPAPWRVLTAAVLALSLGALLGYGEPIVRGASLARSASKTEPLLSVKGHGNRVTPAITTHGRWTLQWSYRCATGGGRFQVAAYRRGHSQAEARITKQGHGGHGTRASLAGGTVHLVVKSTCAWSVTAMRDVPAPVSTPAPSPTDTPTPTPTPSPTPTPMATPALTSDGLAIHVDGNHLEDSQGRAIRLVGVNVPAGAQCIPTGPHTSPGIFAFPSVDGTVAAIAGWHANVVRITINEDCWLGINGGDATYTGAAYRTAIAHFVSALHAAGIYVIIDLHANAPGATPSTSPQVMADADHAAAYWTSVAATFKNDPAIIFEPYNEPHITPANAETANPWQCWRDGCTIDELDEYHNTPVPGAAPWQSAGMQSLVDAIRATGATQPILIDGLNWAQDLTHMLQYLPSDPLHQLIADYHNYMGPGSRNTPTYWDTVIAPFAAQMPLMTSEFGERDCSSTYVTRYMEWADAHDVSYIPWVWMPWQCSAYGLIADWNGTPSDYGRTFYDHFHAVNGAGSDARRDYPAR